MYPAKRFSAMWKNKKLVEERRQRHGKKISQQKCVRSDAAALRFQGILGSQSTFVFQTAYGTFHYLGIPLRKRWEESTQQVVKLLWHIFFQVIISLARHVREQPPKRLKKCINFATGVYCCRSFKVAFICGYGGIGIRKELKIPR